MATLRQKLVVQKIRENKGNVSKAMREAGYSPKIKNPSQVLQSKGVQELINKYIPQDHTLQALREDIDAKPQDRFQELQLSAKINGLLRENTLNLNTDKLVIVVPKKGE